MGKSHATCGLIAGVGLDALAPAAPWGIRALVVITAGGAALLNDFDHTSATAARSLGFVTKLIAAAVAQVSLAIYYATATDEDPPDRKSGHRLVTHSVPFCLFVGGLVAVLGLVSPIGAALGIALLAGLLAHGLKRQADGLFWSALLVSLWVFTQETGWSWLVALAVTTGCLVHLAGDWMTNSGLPLLWPLTSQGRRWRLVHAPLTFAAGSHHETVIRWLVLYPSLAVAIAWETGLLAVIREAHT